ncbi:hypothetical protein [Salinibacterium sp. GXW1014]
MERRAPVDGEPQGGARVIVAYRDRDRVTDDIWTVPSRVPSR